MMETMLSRRRLLASASVVAAASVMPKVVLAKYAAAPPVLSWAVGSCDDWNWLPIKATTAHEARLEWMGQTCGTNGCCEETQEAFNPECECEECRNYFRLDVERREEWDELEQVDIGDENWFNAGLGACCSKCEYETFRGNGGVFVDGNLLCEDCASCEAFRARAAGIEVREIAGREPVGGEKPAADWPI